MASPEHAREPLALTGNAATVRRRLAFVTLLIALASLAVELSSYVSESDPLELAYPIFSLSFEQNLPTWYSACLLLACGGLLVLSAFSAHKDRPIARRFWALAIAFFWISMDEVVGVPEAASWLFETSGWLYFGWVIPAAAVVTLFGVYQIKLLRALPRRVSLQFIAAGAIYVGGALVMELPLGYWAESNGSDNLVYAMIDLVEESFEILGASLFLAALIEHLETRHSAITLRL